MKFNVAIGLFLDYCTSKNLRQKTILSYEQSARLFAAWCERCEGITEVEQCSELVMRKYIRELKSRGKYAFISDEDTERYNHPQNRRDYRKPMANVSINNYLRNLRVFFNWLTDAECLMKSPLAKVRNIPAQRTSKEYLTDEEVKMLLRQLDDTVFSEYRDKMVMMLMLDSGMRVGETLSLDVDQLDLTSRTIHLTADKTKGRKDRTVFFSTTTANELRRWLRYKDRYCDSELAFPVKHNGTVLAVSHYEANFRKYLQRTNIQKHISPHTLRNNFAKRCLMSGMDIYTLSRLLGHSSVKVTEKAYLDVTDLDLRKQYARFSPMDSIFG